MSQAARVAAAKTGRLPHEFLLAVSRGEKTMIPTKNAETGKVTMVERYPTFEEMLNAAEKAAPFYAPRLSAIAAKINTPGNPWAEILEFADGKTRGLPGRNADQGAASSD